MTTQTDRPTAAKGTAGMAAVCDNAESTLYTMAKADELHPKRGYDALLRPAVPMSLETHRLLRAVAIKRAKHTPGEQPSIGAIVEELVEQARGALEREAGAFYKRELAKKR